MKAQLTFDLDDPDDAERYRRANKVDDLCYIITEIVNERDDSPDALCEHCRARLMALIADNNVALEEIWS